MTACEFTWRQDGWASWHTCAMPDGHEGAHYCGACGEQERSNAVKGDES